MKLSKSIFVFCLLVQLVFSQVARLEVKCEWTAKSTDQYPNHKNVLGTTMVIDTPFDSGNEAVEIIFISYNYSDGGAESGRGTNPSYYGVIRIVNGRTCELHQTLNEGQPDTVIASSTLALGDVDNDGIPEIFAQRALTGLIAWKWNAAQGKYVKWWVSTASSYTTSLRWDGPALHDLDNDGIPELISGGEVYNSLTGARIDTSPLLFGVNGRQLTFTTISDVDNDGLPELIYDKVYSWNTSTKKWVQKYNPLVSRPWAGADRGGFAVADFGTPGATPQDFDAGNFDGRAEIAVVFAGSVGLFTLEGQMIFLISSVGGVDIKGGGAPIVGNFDNDDTPEIASANGNELVLFDLNCRLGTEPGCSGLPFIRWRKQSQDFSSQVTSSAVFQFSSSESPGAVYADECFVRVYQGTTGEVLFSSFRTSCTWYENPVIANVDGQYGSEVIVGSNANCNVACPSIDPIHRGTSCNTNSDCMAGSNCVGGYCRCTTDAHCDSNTRCRDPIDGTPGSGKTCRAYHPTGTPLQGIRVLYDSFGQWLDSRKIWNQHTYSITNVLDNGRIPKTSDYVSNYHPNIVYQIGFNSFRQNARLCDCFMGTCISPTECECTPPYGGMFCEDITTGLYTTKAQTTALATTRAQTTSAAPISSTQQVQTTAQRTTAIQTTAVRTTVAAPRITTETPVIETTQQRLTTALYTTQSVTTDTLETTDTLVTTEVMVTTEEGEDTTAEATTGQEELSGASVLSGCMVVVLAFILLLL